MKNPFRFKRVQRVREIEEEQAREEFITQERIARHAEEAADTMQAEIDRAHQELSETRMFKRVPPHELLTAQTTLENLDATVSEQRRRARDLRNEAETKRAAWEGSRSEVKTLERLEQRFIVNAREEELKAEAKELDELIRRPTFEGQAPEGEDPGGPALKDSDPWDAAAPPSRGASSSNSPADDDEEPLPHS